METIRLIISEFSDVLISPKRVTERLTDLSDSETADMFIVAKKVQAMLEKHHNVKASTICVQDGKEAGQTVPVS